MKLTRKQIAEHYEVTTTTIDSWEKEGMPVARKPGIRGAKYLIEDINKWLEQRSNKNG